MKTLLAVLAILLLAVVVPSRSQAPHLPISLQPSRTKAESIKPVLQILDEAGVSASIEFTGTCESRNLPEFPPFRSVPSGDSPVQALREMFSADPAMHVAQDTHGTIRMIEAGVPADVLNIKIKDLRFEGPNAYYPNAASERIILQAPEFTRFIREHGIGWPSHFGEPFAALGNPNPSPDWPHITGSLHDVTLSEALDHVLSAFPGVWIYENCAAVGNKGRVVYIHFVHYHWHGSAMHVLE